MASSIPPSERKRLAADLGLNEQYLYQCLTGRRDMNPAEARRVERESAGKLRRWDICQRTWSSIWPELIGTEGAPALAPAGIALDRRDPTRPSPYAGTDLDRRAPANHGREAA